MAKWRSQTLSFKQKSKNVEFFARRPTVREARDEIRSVLAPAKIFTSDVAYSFAAPWR